MSLNSLSLPFFAQSSHLIQFLQAPISLPPSLLAWLRWGYKNRNNVSQAIDPP